MDKGKVKEIVNDLATVMLQNTSEHECPVHVKLCENYLPKDRRQCCQCFARSFFKDHPDLCLKVEVKHTCWLCNGLGKYFPENSNTMQACTRCLGTGFDSVSYDFIPISVEEDK